MEPVFYRNKTYVTNVNPYREIKIPDRSKSIWTKQWTHFVLALLVEAIYFRDSSKLSGLEVEEIEEVKRQESMMLMVHDENTPDTNVLQNQ